ncbi:MAG: hypothetical protein JWO87_1417 [Phycisphaerales bacterium]|nr:hypothetical protein [Phycisphaerales bacterium]
MPRISASALLSALAVYSGLTTPAPAFGEKFAADPPARLLARLDSGQDLNAVTTEKGDPC